MANPVRAAAAAARARILAARPPANPVVRARPQAIVVGDLPLANPVVRAAIPVVGARPLANAVVRAAIPVVGARPLANPVVVPVANPVVVPLANPVAVANPVVVPNALPALNENRVDIAILRQNNTFPVLDIFNKFSKQHVMDANQNIDTCRNAITQFITTLAGVNSYSRDNLVRDFNIRDTAPAHQDMGVASDRNCIICRIQLFTNRIKGIRSDNNELFCEQCFQNNIILKPLEEIAFSQIPRPRQPFTPIYHPLNGADSNFSGPFAYNLALNQELSRTLTLYQGGNNDIELLASIIGSNASMAFRYPAGITVPPNKDTTPLAQLVYRLFYNATIETAQILSQR